MKKTIIDVFPYFSPTGKELLELRIKMLNPYVDKFVLIESNRTQSGDPIEFTLQQTISELGLPADKIKIVNLHIPEVDLLEIQEIDKLNCLEYSDPDKNINSTNINSLRARARERLQKDAILSVLDELPDNSIFILSDSDEIINYKYINWVSNYLVTKPNAIFKIPLVHLEGKANLRVVYKDSQHYKMWDGAMIMCTKHHLNIATPTQMRSNNNNPFEILYITEDGSRVEDMGWHFSWMGNNSYRKIKKSAFCHYDDTFSFIGNKKYCDISTEVEPVAGGAAPSGDINCVLEDYPLTNLPIELLDNGRLQEFFIGTLTSGINLEYKAACESTSDINEHLNLLVSLAKECSSVTELGVRTGVSSTAFIYSGTHLTSYDIEENTEAKCLFNRYPQASYIIADSLTVQLEATDLLFIDTWHTFAQLYAELTRHESITRKYIVLHDTHTFGIVGEDGGVGLLPAVMRFLSESPHWKIKHHFINNNGLTVLERVL